MEINFNNLRTSIMVDYNDIVDTLNTCRAQDQEGGEIIVSPEDLVKDFDSLRRHIIALCCIYEEGQFESIKDINLKSLRRVGEAAAE